MVTVATLRMVYRHGLMKITDWKAKTKPVVPPTTNHKRRSYIDIHDFFTVREKHLKV